MIDTTALNVLNDEEEGQTDQNMMDESDGVQKKQSNLVKILENIEEYLKLFKGQPLQVDKRDAKL